MIRPEERGPQKIRRWIVNIGALIFFSALGFFLLKSMHELVFPVILGAFLAYVFKPLVSAGYGSPLKRYSRLALRFSVIFAIIYFGVVSIKSSLPNEKEKLELLVRLQYRLNLRYSEWMGLSSKSKDEKGNFIYSTIGKDLDPLMNKINNFLTLDKDQRSLFIKYRKGFNGEPPVSEKYFEYFMANLKIMKSVEAENEARAQLEQSAATLERKDEGAGLSQIMRSFSIWLVFPLAFMFFLIDKGQILHFLMRLIPNRYFELSKTVIDKVDTALGHYIRGTMIECGLVGASIAVGLFLCGFKLQIAVLVGLIGGLTNAIPFVGTALACVVGSIFGLIAEDIQPLLPFINESNLILGVFGVVMVAHLLDNAVFQPLVVGGAVHIHPLVVILGVFGGSLAFGFAGLLLAIPSIVILKVVTETLYRGLKSYRII